MLPDGFTNDPTESRASDASPLCGEIYRNMDLATSYDDEGLPPAAAVYAAQILHLVRLACWNARHTDRQPILKFVVARTESSTIAASMASLKYAAALLKNCGRVEVQHTIVEVTCAAAIRYALQLAHA